MNEVEAISKARQFLGRGGYAPVHWERARATLESARGRRWAVDFPLVIPEGEVWSPDSICVMVCDDTGNCEIEMQL